MQSSSNQQPSTDKESIRQIAIEIEGGMIGTHERFALTSGAGSYRYSMDIDSTKTIELKFSNVAREWDKLQAMVQLRDFRKIKSGPSRQPVDGMDIRIIVTTGQGDYSVMNAHGDILWDSIYVAMTEYMADKKQQHYGW